MVQAIRHVSCVLCAGHCHKAACSWTRRSARQQARHRTLVRAAHTAALGLDARWDCASLSAICCGEAALALNTKLGWPAPGGMQPWPTLLHRWQLCVTLHVHAMLLLCHQILHQQSAHWHTAHPYACTTPAATQHFVYNVLVVHRSMAQQVKHKEGEAHCSTSSAHTQVVLDTCARQTRPDGRVRSSRHLRSCSGAEPRHGRPTVQTFVMKLKYYRKCVSEHTRALPCAFQQAGCSRTPAPSQHQHWAQRRRQQRAHTRCQAEKRAASLMFSA